jgi:hypothetical protein
MPDSRFFERDISIPFSTTKPMSRLKVLQKLAQETGGELQLGFCGTGATILFGAYPCFTTLKLAPQGGTTNLNLPPAL